MKKRIPILERLLAVILVLAMVLSYIPAGAEAEKRDANAVVSLYAELVREAEEKTVQPAEPSVQTADPQTPADAEAGIPEAQTAEEKTYVYNYTLTLKLGDERVTLKNENVKWFLADGTAVETETAEPGRLTGAEQDDIYAVVNYDGISFQVELAEESDRGTFTIEAANQTWSGTVTRGALFELKAGLKQEVISGLTYSRQISDNLSTGETENTYYTAGEDDITITDTWTSATGAVYAQKVYHAKVETKYPEAEITVNGGNAAAGWYSEAQTVRVYVKNDLGLVSASYLPSVTAGEQSVASWVADGNGGFTMEIPVSESKTITYGKGTGVEKSITLNIDSFKPIAEIVRTYTRPGETEMLAGIFQVYTGKSGLDTVLINGNQINAQNLEPVASAENEPGTYKYIGFFEIPAVNAEQFDIVATTVAGLSNSGKGDGIMKVSFIGTSALALLKDADGVLTNYLADDKQSISFQIDNWYDALELQVIAKDQDGNAVEVSTAKGDDVCTGTVSLANGLSELAVVVTDPAAPEGKRETRYTFGETYRIDKTAPVVKVKRDCAPVRVEQNTEYFGNAVSYIFTVEDALWAKSDFTVSFRMAGENQDRVAEYSASKGGYVVVVNSGENLTSLSVTGKDLTGNELSGVRVDEQANGLVWGDTAKINCDVRVDTTAPKVTAKISDNVKLFYTNNGQAYAVLDENADSSKVVLTVTVEDANLDVAALGGDNWTADATEPTRYIGTFEVEVAQDAVGILEYAFEVKDMAGHMSGACNVSTEGYNTALTLAPLVENETKTGTYKGTIHIDRSVPESVTGDSMVQLTLKDGTESETAEGTKLFNGSFSYDMALTSDVNWVTWELDNTQVFDAAEQVTSPITINSNNNNDRSGSYEIVVTAAQNVEASSVLVITLEDAAGNRFCYTEPFAVDTYAPRVGMNFGEEETGKAYYNAQRRAVVTVTDTFLADYKINTTGTVDGSTVTFADGEHTLGVAASDAAGNAADEAVEPFTVDTTAPVIKLELFHSESKVNHKPAKTVGSDDYFRAGSTLRVTISDVNLTAEQSGAAELKYTLEGKSEVTFTLGEVTEWKQTTQADGTVAYVHEIELKNNDVLTALSVSARDNAGNAASGENVVSTSNLNLGLGYDSEENVHESTRCLIIDNQSPVITVNKVVEEGRRYVQTYNDVAYHNGDVTYEITVSDNFLDLEKNAGSFVVITRLSGGGSVQQEVITSENNSDASKSAVDEYKCTITVEDGQVLESITIMVHDNMGDVPQEIKVLVNGEDAEQDETNSFAFNRTSGRYEYNGIPVLVDKTAPEMSMAFSGNVKGFYRNDNTKTFYLILNEQIKEESGEDIIVDPETVTVTIKAKDLNLSLDGENAYGLKSNKEENGWSGKLAVNTLGEAELVYESEPVRANEVVCFTIDATVTDLAANPAARFDIEVNENVATIEPDSEGNKGNINYDISIDRRPPSSSEATPPVIEITPELPEGVKQTKTADDKDLFNGSFVYNLTVTDGAASGKNAGLKRVKWSVSDPNGVVNAVAVEEVNKDHIYFRNDIQIPVTINGEGESNGVVIYVEAEDNVGNTITYSKTIGVDNLAPRVKVENYNKDIKQTNGTYYFNMDPDIRVAVTDLNFDPSSSVITTQVDVPGWTDSQENTYRVDLKYTANGGYTFVMESADLAGNSASFDIPEAVKQFTIDSEAPTVKLELVTGDKEPVKGSDDGIFYYVEPITIRVRISDRNLNQSGSSNYPVATLTYSVKDIASGSEEEIIVALDNGLWNAVTDENDNEIYTYDIKLDYNQVLSSLSVKARDNAGNAATKENVDYSENLELELTCDDTGIISNGTTLSVDGKAPVVVVKKTLAEGRKHVQTFNGVAYHNGEVTYDIWIGDHFLDKNAIKVEANRNNIDINVYDNNSDVPDQVSGLNNIYHSAITVRGGKTLEDISISVTDQAGMTPILSDGENNTVVVDDSTGLTKFVQNEDGTLRWSNDSADVVVDTTAPEVKAKFSDNVAGIYERNGKIYLIMKAPVDTQNEQNDSETVTVTFEVEDANLTVDAQNKYGLKPNTWEVEGSKAKLSVEIPAVEVNGIASYTLVANIIDLAGNPAATFDIEAGSDVVKIEPNAETGEFEKNITIDRRTPTSGADDQVPFIEITPELPEGVEQTETAGGKDLFNGSFEYKLNVSDSFGNPDIGAGLKSVEWSVTDANGVVAEETELTTTSEENTTIPGEYTIPVTINSEGESNDVTISITVVDNVGNTIRYQKVIGVDNLKPRVTIEPGNKTFYKVNDKYYYNANQKIVVNVTELNFDGEASLINGKEAAWEKHENKVEGIVWYSAYVEYNQEGDDYEFTTASTDLAGNAGDVNIAPELKVFTIDKTAPEISLEIVEKELVKKNTVGETDYFDEPFAIRVTMTDHNLNKAGDNSDHTPVATLTYTTEANGATVVELSGDKWNLVQNEDGDETYTYDIPLADGDVLTGLTVSALDNANNPAKAENVKCSENLNLGLRYDAQTNTHKSSRVMVVDATAPAVVVEKVLAENCRYIQSFGGNAYYNGEVTYNVNVSDTFLDLAAGAGSIEIYAELVDGTGVSKPVPFEFVEPETDAEQTAGLLSAEDVYNYTLTVTDGIKLNNIVIKVNDNIGHNPEKIVVVNPEETSAVGDKLITAFASNDDGATWTYSKPIIVDATSPVVTAEFSSNVIYYYRNGNILYVVLNESTKADNAGIGNEAPQSVTLTLTVEDRNMTLNEDNVYGLQHGDDTPAWAGDLAVNSDGNTAVLVAKSADVGPDNVVFFELDATIIDLAGNCFKDFEIVAGGSHHLVTSDANGRFVRTFSVDRRVPSSDKFAPKITIDPIRINPTKTADGKNLFNKSFSYDLRVTDILAYDANNNELDPSMNSGLKSVKVTVTDDNHVVSTVDMTELFVDAEGNHVYDTDFEYHIPISAKENAESNEVNIHIIAEDNVGNVIEYTETIGVDRWNPRVTISSSNHDFTHPNANYYFKADQNITVTVEDLNFNAATSLINTQVGVPGWSSMGGIKYGQTMHYGADNDYTFAVSVTDLANNAVSTENGTIGIEPQEKAFTMDQTAPVIHVDYNPSLAVGTDNAGVQYFDSNRSVTVTIEEHNFNAADVVSDLGVNNRLSAFTTRGDRHTASETFTEGNNYSVKVTYTDLAGNPAVPYASPTFSVDLTPPEIKISGMKEEGMNIVPGVLELDFIIHDDQKNLVKDFDVEVIFLDRNNEKHVIDDSKFFTVVPANDRTTGYVNFNDFEHIKANDGIYIVRITARDYAGHVVSKGPVVMSVNRFGSTFMAVEGYTTEFLTPNQDNGVYREKVEGELVFKEYNPNRVWQDAEKKEVGSKITVAVNGKNINLVKDTDYSVTEERNQNGTEGCYVYTYTIFPEFFETNGDGEYTMYFYSVDEALHENHSEFKEDSLLQLDSEGNYTGKIQFGLDDTDPVITILGIENGESYYEPNRRVQINVADNSFAGTIEILVDGNTVVGPITMEEAGDIKSDWFYQDKNDGNYYLNLSGKPDPQTVTVKITDQAGNETVSTIENVMLSDSLLDQYMHSTPAKLLTLVLLVALTILIFVLVKKRKKDTEEATPVS